MTDRKPHKRIRCGRCDGHGIVDGGYHYPDECPDCGGAGTIVQYANGSLAKYYGGPFLSGPDLKAESRAL